VRENGVGHRHVDVAATTAGAGVDDAGEQPDQRAQRAAEQVADLEVGNCRRTAGDADLVEQAAVGQVIEVVAGAVAVGAVLAVAGDRAINDARVDCRYRLVADSQLVDDAGAKALDDDIRAGGEAHEGGDAGGLLEVQRQAALVAIDQLEIARLAVHCAGAACVVAGTGVLDLDHVGAEIAEVHGCQRSWQESAQIKDAKSVERGWAHAEGLSKEAGWWGSMAERQVRATMRSEQAKALSRAGKAQGGES
jgi:hypothetical protein